MFVFSASRSLQRVESCRLGVLPVPRRVGEVRAAVVVMRVSAMCLQVFHLLLLHIALAGGTAGVVR